RRPTTDDRRPTTDDRRPTTDDRRPLRVAVLDERPTTDHGPRTTDHEPESACCNHCTAHPLTPAADELLRLAAAVEWRSAHPLARAVVAAAEARALALPAAHDFQSRGGRGATATVEGRQVTIGNRAMFGDALLTPEIEARLAALEQAGSTAMLVGYDGALRGLIAAADAERAESGAVLAALRRLGVAHVAMLTGDAAPVAARVAARAGVDETRAELLPEQKLAAIEELLARHGRVGMVGDGVNDAPALARATVGVAMGAAGSDAALETADVTLMSDDLTKLPFAIGLSRATRRVITQNVSFALAVKAVFLLATLLGAATLWMAVLADTGAALIVIANGMRLLHYRFTSKPA
ncbi:MAG: HAD-IC family P-type ATPase, partial [Roseiflexaceae bacterium]